MEMPKVLDSIKGVDWKRHEDRIKEIVKTKPLLIGGGVLALLLLINLIGIGSRNESRIIERPTEINFQNGRILTTGRVHSTTAKSACFHRRRKR